jgi:hypothetical protein
MTTRTGQKNANKTKSPLFERDFFANRASFMPAQRPANLRSGKAIKPASLSE